MKASPGFLKNTCYHLKRTAMKHLATAALLGLAMPGAAATFPSDTLRADTASHRLAEAKVTATRLLFITKGDTTIYDMDAVLAMRGDVLADVVRKMPGLELRDGTLYFKGEPVSRLMVNGEDFARGDLRAGLDNLPAFLIKSIKAYRRRSDQALRTGIDDGVREQVIDVVLRREYLGTWTGNADAAYGTEDYWLLRGFANNFGERWRLSAYAGLTNTAQYQSTSDEGAWSENGGAGGSSGLTTFKKPGASFFWKNKRPTDRAGYFKIDGSTSWDYRRHHDRNALRQESFRDAGSTFRHSASALDDWHETWTANLGFEGNLTDSTFVQFRPSFARTVRDNATSGRSGEWNADPTAFGASPLDSLFARPAAEGWPADGSAVNATRSHSQLHSAQNSYSHYLYATHKLSARGHRLSLRHQLFYARGNSASNDLTEYRYFIAQDNRPDPLVNRRYDSRWHNFNQQTFVDLFVPAGRFFTARATYGNVTADNLNLQSGYRLDTLGGRFADYDDYLAHFGLLPAEPGWQEAAREASSTLHIDNHTQQHWAEAYVQLDNRRGLYAHIQSTLRMASERLDYMRGFGSPLPLHRHYREFFVTSQLRYETDSLGRLNLQYSYNTWTPNFLQLVTIPNDEDPLHVTLGNPSLRQTHGHSASLQYDISLRRMRFVAFGLSGGTTRDATTQRATYDPATGVTTTQAVNVDGPWNLGGNLNFNTPLDRRGRLSFNTSLAYNLNHNVAFATGTAREATRYAYDSHRLYALGQLSWRMDKLFVQAAATWNFTTLRSHYAPAEGLSLCTAGYDAYVEWQAPWGMEFQTALRTRHYMGDTSAGLDRLNCIWNASLSKSVLRSRALTFKLEASDILGQRSAESFQMSSSGTAQSYSLRVERFVMLHVIYRFSTARDKDA